MSNPDDVKRAIMLDDNYFIQVRLSRRSESLQLGSRRTPTSASARAGAGSKARLGQWMGCGPRCGSCVAGRCLCSSSPLASHLAGVRGLAAFRCALHVAAYAGQPRVLGLVVSHVYACEHETHTPHVVAG